MLPGIAASAGAVLILEIGLTRIFSYTIWYHFAYLTISVALLGFGAAGSVLAAWPDLRRRRGFLSGCALAAQLGILVCLLVVSHVSLDPLAIVSDFGQLARLVVYYGAVALPFFAGGFLVAAPLQAHPSAVGRLYGWDLLGAGAACGAVVPLIWWVGTPVATAGATLALAFACWAYAEPGLRLRLSSLALALCAATLLTAARTEFPAASTKFISQFLAMPNARLAWTRWTPVNRVDVVEFDPPLHEGSYHAYGASPFYTGPSPGYYMLGNDGDSCAVMYQWDGDPASAEFLKHHVLAAPYVVLQQPRVLAIGMGGGADILNAVVHGARFVTGVELNPMVVRAGRERYADFNGRLLERPDVEAVAAEGRSFLRSRDSRYDLIEINSVDTLSALSTGAYVLSESFLYTSDAIGDYLDHLEPNGVFAMAVGDTVVENRRPRHTLRLASIVRKALHDRGVANPERHVVVIGNIHPLSLTHTLVKNEPFTAEEMAALQSFVEANGFTFWHRPDRASKSLVTRILEWDDARLERFFAGEDLNLAPTSDDSPFFFNFYKWRALARPETYRKLEYNRTLATGQIVLAIMLLQSIVFGAAATLLPLRRVPLAGGATAPQRLALLGYFGALGTGFILLEISFIQRFVLFLGYPTYSLTVVMLSLLVASGAGSLASERVRRGSAAVLPPRLALLALLVAAEMAASPAVFRALLGAPLAVRVATSIALVVPLGLVLGSFFPLGIRVAERLNPRLVPWAWAVNACATVVGTLLAVVFAMAWGFTLVAALAVAIYAVGVLGLVWAERRAA
jgi:hypothetical protein